MRDKFFAVAMVFALVFASVPFAFAQDAKESAVAAENSNMAEKIELATKMHQINPAREQIDMAINKVATAIPDAARDDFLLSVREAMDYDLVERESINAMAEVYTVEELRAMVAYYTSPEAVHLKERSKQYEEIFSPKVYEMLDRSIMKARTGGYGD